MLFYIILMGLISLVMYLLYKHYEIYRYIKNNISNRYILSFFLSFLNNLSILCSSSPHRDHSSVHPWAAEEESGSFMYKSPVRCFQKLYQVRGRARDSFVLTRRGRYCLSLKQCPCVWEKVRCWEKHTVIYFFINLL